MTPPDVLVRITETRRRRVADDVARSGAAGDLTEGPPRTPADNAFLGALAAKQRRREPAIIAEVKMGSPRLGNLHGQVDPIAQAKLYAANGATCLSVVVEPDFFHGGYDLLAACRERVASAELKISFPGIGFGIFLGTRRLSND